MPELTREEATKALTAGRQVYFVSGEFAKAYRFDEGAGIPTPLWCESAPRESPQWTPAEIARFRAENSPPLIPNRLGKHADAK